MKCMLMKSRRPLATALLTFLVGACASVDPLTDSKSVPSNTELESLSGTWRGSDVVSRTGACQVSVAGGRGGDTLEIPIRMKVSLDSKGNLSTQFLGDHSTSPDAASITGHVDSDFRIKADKSYTATCHTLVVRERSSISGRFVSTSKGLAMELMGEDNACKDMGCTFHFRDVLWLDRAPSEAAQVDVQPRDPA